MLTPDAGPAWLFCPGNRPDRFEKARVAADTCILDLEDAVPASDKPDARDAIVAEIGRGDGSRLLVRINRPSTVDQSDDLVALESAGLAPADRPILLVPKVESAHDVEVLAPWRVIATCETAGGVLAAREIAGASNCVGMAWGPDDLTLSASGWSSWAAPGEFTPLATHARVTVLLAAAAAGRFALDSPHLSIEDAAAVEADARLASKMGFNAKAAIHPAQIRAVRHGFLPPVEMIDDARKQAALNGGAHQVDGRMVDAPHLDLARRILALAERVSSDT